MTGQTIILASTAQRHLAAKIIFGAPDRAVVNVREATRSSGQNDKMWAMLSDVARAKPEGRVLSPDGWKCLFMQQAGFKFTWEPGLDGEGVVPIGFKSSRLSKGEFSELIECIAEYGSRHGVEWSEPVRTEQRSAA